MIKIGIRHNLIYPIIYSSSDFVRQIDSILMKDFINFKSSLLLTLIMFFSESISGLIFYKLERKYFKKNKGINSKFMGIKIIQTPSKVIRKRDNYFIILIFIFLAALFDFLDFANKTFYIQEDIVEDKFLNLYSRLKGILIICSAILCYYILKIPIYKHQKFSLLIIFVCLLIVIIIECLIKFQTYLVKILLLMFLGQIFLSFRDVIEKYLLDYNFINPYQILRFEGFFGLIMTSICFFVIEEPFDKLIKSYDTWQNQQTIYILLLTIFFIFYFLLSGSKNVYRLLTNKVYSPTTTSLSEALFAPLLITIDIFHFDKSNTKGIIYIVINLVISIIMIFTSLVYNEFLVLNCCKLEYNTHYNISNRADESVNIFDQKENEDSEYSDD